MMNISESLEKIVISYITSIEKRFDYSTGLLCLDEMCADYTKDKFLFFSS